MKIKGFGVEIWMNLYENNCEYNLAETCVAPLSVEELLEICGKKDEVVKQILEKRLSYGDIEGSDALRGEIVDLFSGASIDLNNVVTTHGGIGANFLTLFTLVEPQDHVVSVLPTYQQLYSIPDSFGADVSILELKQEEGFLPNTQELEKLIKPETKVICINNPNNPTGALMDKSLLQEIANIAKSHNAWVLCDEVYRGLEHKGEGFSTSIVHLYEKGISTGSVSKTFSLAGLRTGWIVGPKEFIHEINKHRDYTTISCGVLEDYLAALALSNKDKLLKRNREIVLKNKAVLDDFIKSQKLLDYVKPNAGSTALIRYAVDLPSEELCKKLLDQKGVMLLPGAAMEMEGFARMGYACEPEVLEKGLKLFGEFLEQL